MRTSKKYEALNALADIREFVRGLGIQLEDIQTGCIDYVLPKPIVDDFNLVATRLGADKDWCKE